MVAVEHQPDLVGAELLEGWLGLTKEQYRDRSRLEETLVHSPLARITPNRQAEVITTLARLLRLAPDRGAMFSVALLGAWLALPAGNEGGFLANNLNQLDQFGLEYQAGVVIVLADSIYLVGGQSARAEATLLMESWARLQIGPAETESIVEVWATSQVVRLRPRNQAAFLLVLAEIWSSLPERGSAIANRLLENWLAISPMDYEIPSTLAARLTAAPFAKIPPNTRAALLLALVRGFALDLGQYQTKGLLLLEAWLGLKPGDFLVSDQIRSRLQELVELSASNRTLVVEALVDALRFGSPGGERRAAFVAEAWLGLSESDYTDPDRLQEALFRSPLEQGTMAGGLSLLTSLAECLGLLEERGASHLVALMKVALGIDAFSVADGNALGARLESGRFAGLTPEERLNAIRVLADGLAWLPDGRVGFGGYADRELARAEDCGLP